MTIKKEEVVSLGIVLKTHPYKESDSLVTVYFKDYGKMTLIARGVKKLKSKNASACQSLTLSEFTFIPRNGLSTMIKASSVDFYRYIKENLELEAYASYFMEFVLKNEEDNQPDLEIFDTLKKSLVLAKSYCRLLLVTGSVRVGSNHATWLRVSTIANVPCRSNTCKRPCSGFKSCFTLARLRGLKKASSPCTD